MQWVALLRRDTECFAFATELWIVEAGKQLNGCFQIGQGVDQFLAQLFQLACFRAGGKAADTGRDWMDRASADHLADPVGGPLQAQRPGNQVRFLIEQLEQAVCPQVVGQGHEIELQQVALDNFAIAEQPP